MRPNLAFAVLGRFKQEGALHIEQALEPASHASELFGCAFSNCLCFPSASPAVLLCLRCAVGGLVAWRSLATHTHNAAGLHWHDRQTSHTHFAIKHASQHAAPLLAFRPSGARVLKWSHQVQFGAKGGE